jgi:glycosyltransferase involved in cell wall biosynthesis
VRVCYFGAYRAEYSRNQIMIEGLRRNGVEVVECHESLWRGVEDRVEAAAGGWKRPAFWRRVLHTYGRLLRRYRSVGAYDVLIVGYPGQIDVFLARLLSWWRRRPLVWDVFMSIYLIAVERRLDARSGFTVGLLRRIEWLAARLPDRLILDTAEYMAWFGTTHGIPPERFRLVPTGADDRVFGPLAAPAADDGFFRVIYYGTFIPNHGVETIVEAARLLADRPDVCFELIGEGPDKPKAQDLAQRYGLPNVVFADWMTPAELLARVAGADVCLGAFGTTPQSLMTVQNKIYEGLAMAKPVITGDGPAVRAALTHGQDVYLCRRADPADLAQAILALHDDAGLRRRLAENGIGTFREQFDLVHNGRRYAGVLQDLLSEVNRAAG